MKKNAGRFMFKNRSVTCLAELTFCVFTIIFLLGCGNAGKQEQKAATTNSDSLTKDFFPVTYFLKGQLMQMDSLQVTPLQVTTVNGKTDSSWIKIAELKPLLKDFTSFEIYNTNLLPYFSESKFNDESTEAITFTYSPKAPLPDSITIRHWDLYITPSTGKVKRVYVVKQVLEDGKPYIQQLTWQTDKSARITTLQDKPGGSVIVKDTKFVWSF